jgi:UDP-N-acetyl-D-glucosamine dehydrogenase
MQPATTTHAAILEEKIGNRTARVGIIGLGYVGLPLAVEFARAGFTVTGIDVQESKVAKLNSGESYVQDVPSEILRPLVEAKKFQATTAFSAVAGLDTINIAVPTPLRKTKDPAMSYIVSACQKTAKYFDTGKLVILDSTT